MVGWATAFLIFHFKRGPTVNKKAIYTYFYLFFEVLEVLTGLRMMFERSQLYWIPLPVFSDRSLLLIIFLRPLHSRLSFCGP